MAEVVGTIASGIAIAGLAGQVAVLVSQLKGFWDQIKGAPSDIQHLFEQLDCLSLVLVQIKVDHPLPDALFDTNILNQSLILCQRAEAELRVLAKELEEQINATSRWKKRLGSLKVILRKEDIKRLKSRLETTIGLLSLAHQCHISGMMRMQYDLCLNRLPAAVNSAQPDRTALDTEVDGVATSQVSISTQVNPKALNMARYTYWTSQQTPIEILVGSLQYQKGVQRHKGKPRNILEVTYQLPTWMSYQTWKLLSYKALSGWQLNLSTFRTLPDEHIIFQCAWNGDLDLMREILSTHEGYVSDRNVYGLTPLHCAARIGHRDMCRLLVREGADVLIEDQFGFTPLHQASWYEKSAGREVLRVLIEAGSSEVLIQDYTILERFSGDADTFCYLSHQCFPPLHQAPKESRLNVLLKQIFNNSRMSDWASDGRVILKLIKLEEVVNLRGLHDWSILHACSRALISYGISEESLPFIVGLIHDSVINGDKGNLSGLDSNQHTPLQILLVAADYWLSPKQRIRHLSIWIKTLARAGVDLEKYGETELSMFRQQYTPYRIGFPAYRVSTFSYGSHPEDWIFWFDSPTGPIYRYSREFWASVDRPLVTTGPCTNLGYPVPGAWPQVEHEDETYYDLEDLEDSDYCEMYQRMRLRRARKARYDKRVQFLVNVWQQYENPEELEDAMCTSRFSLLVLSQPLFIEALTLRGLDDAYKPEDFIPDHLWCDNDDHEYEKWANAIGKRCRELLRLDEEIVSQIQNDFERRGIPWAVRPLTYENIPESGLRLFNIDLPPIQNL